MPGINTDAVRRLMGEIEALKGILESKGQEGRRKQNSINLEGALNQIPRNEEEEVDSTGWRNLGEDRQRNIHHELSRIIDALRAAAEPQPGGYGAALIATWIFWPCAATIFINCPKIVPSCRT